MLLRHQRRWQLPRKNSCLSSSSKRSDFAPGFRVTSSQKFVSFVKIRVLIVMMALGDNVWQFVAVVKIAAAAARTAVDFGPALSRLRLLGKQQAGKQAGVVSCLQTGFERGDLKLDCFSHIANAGKAAVETKS